MPLLSKFSNVQDTHSLCKFYCLYHQTLANVYLALDNDLEILPVLNKIDLPAADPERVSKEIEETIGLDCSAAVHASAKSGIGIEDILEQIVELVSRREY